MLPPLLTREFYLLVAVMGLCTFWRPSIGLALFVATLPAVSYVFQKPVLDVSTAQLMALGVVTGAAFHIWKHSNASEGKHGFPRLPSFAWMLTLLTAYAVAGSARFAPLLSHYPRLLWENVLRLDQLNPFVFIGRTGLWMVAVCLYFVVRWLNRETGAREVLFRGLLAQGVVFVFIFFADLYRYSKPFPEHLFEFRGINRSGSFAIFDDHNSFAVFWLLHICLLFGLFRKSRPWMGWVAGCLFLVYSTLLILSLSLSTMLVYLVMAGLGLAFSLKQIVQGIRGAVTGQVPGKLWKASVAGAVLLVLLVVARYGSVEPMLDSVGDRVAVVSPGRFVESVYRERFFPWFVGWQMFRDSPFFGIGLGRFYLMSAEYWEKAQAHLRTEGSFWARHRHENAHNFFVQMGAETGLVGLSFILAFLVWSLWRCRWRDHTSAAAGVALMAMASVSMAQHPLLVSPLFLTFAVVCGLVPASDLLPKPWKQGRGRRWAWLALALLIVLYATHLFAVWEKMPARFEYGIYQSEKEGDKEFRWISQIALICKPWDQLSTKGAMQLDFRAHNPDVASNALTVRIDQEDFGLSELVLRNNEWHSVRVGLDTDAVLVLECSRTWTPPGEYRRLGVAVSGIPR
ncbi:MAG: O-antigen ligase family protein [Acidobacteria bacterium]|nr:O-antigen ligase family protein [Acidobacteriota bacterium]